ncbi:lipoprotein [Aeromonas dhakensis]
MRFLFFIGATLLVSGCNALPPPQKNWHARHER